jgi:hypothetical protein
MREHIRDVSLQDNAKRIGSLRSHTISNLIGGATGKSHRGPKDWRLVDAAFSQ